MTDFAQWANDNRPEGSIAAAFGLNALAHALADGIAGVTGRASIDGRAGARVLSDVRRHVDVAQFHDEVGGIEASVAAKRDRFGARAWLDHLERRQPFGMTGDTGQSGVDKEPVAVLHQA